MDEKNFESLNVNCDIYRTRLTEKYKARKPYEPRNPKEIKSRIPGVVNKVLVSAGNSVKEGDALMIVESMKMLNTVRAPFEGTIKDIPVSEAEKVEKNRVLIRFQ